MAVDYEQLAPSKYVFLPKMGQEATFEIVTIQSVNDKPDSKFSFKTKKKMNTPDGKEIEYDESMGYHIEATLADGKTLSVTNYSAFVNVFARNGINDGDKIHVKHPEKGKWEVTKIKGE